jgi:transcriptional regulator with XRE-family HTH domain
MALSHDEIGRRINRVREELGIPIEALAEACGAAPSTIASLEAGTLDPVPGDYILIASRVLKTDFRCFVSNVLNDVEENTHQVFRSLTEPQPSDLFAIRRFMMFCMAEQELETLLELQRPSLPPGYPRPGSTEHLHKDQGRRAAIQERDRLVLGNQPLANVFDILRRQGVRLFRHRLEDAQLSGVTVSHPKAGVCVLVNCEDDLYRQFFSAAHEYGHVLFDARISLETAASSLIATRARNWWRFEPTHLQASSCCHRPLSPGIQGHITYPNCQTLLRR